MDDEQHEPSAAERQAAAAAAEPKPAPAGDPGPGPDPDPAEPGPCADCAGRGDRLLAVIALGVAAVIAIMAIDLFTGGQLSGLAFGGRPADAGE